MIPFIKIQAQQLFYTTYEDSVSYLNVVELQNKQHNLKLLSFPNDSINSIEIKNQRIYLTGVDSLHIVDFYSVDDLIIDTKKSFYVKDINKIYASESYVYGLTHWTQSTYTDYNGFVFGALDSLDDSENLFSLNDSYIAGMDKMYDFVFLTDTSFVSLVFKHSGQKDEDNHSVNKYVYHNNATPSFGFNKTKTYLWYSGSSLTNPSIPYSFAMKGEDDFCFILGKHRNNNVASNVVKIQKFKNDAIFIQQFYQRILAKLYPMSKM